MCPGRDNGMSLSQLSKKTGIDNAAISRLENGVASNPTLLTLLSLANGLGKRVVVKLVDAPAAKPKRRRTGCGSSPIGMMDRNQLLGQRDPAASNSCSSLETVGDSDAD